MIVNVIVTQHHRRPSTQISHKPVVLRYIVGGFGSFWLALLVVVGGFGCFGWFWVVPCFSNYETHHVIRPLVYFFYCNYCIVSYVCLAFCKQCAKKETLNLTLLTFQSLFLGLITVGLRSPALWSNCHYSLLLCQANTYLSDAPPDLNT